MDASAVSARTVSAHDPPGTLAGEPAAEVGVLSRRAAIRATAVACVALLLAGIGGAIADQGGQHRVRASSPSTAPPTTLGSEATSSTSATTGTTTSTTVPAPAAGGRSSAALETDLLVPNDLGGYFTSSPPDSHGHLAASGCLAPLGTPAPGVGRAVQFLIGPSPGRLPNLNEQLTSYPTATQAGQAFASLSQTLRSCTSTVLSLAGGAATATFQPRAEPGIGDQITSTAGPFRLGTLAGITTASVVRVATTVIVLVYADRNPPSVPTLSVPGAALRAAVAKAST